MGGAVVGRQPPGAPSFPGAGVRRVCVPVTRGRQACVMVEALCVFHGSPERHCPPEHSMTSIKVKVIKVVFMTSLVQP